MFSLNTSARSTGFFIGLAARGRRSGATLLMTGLLALSGIGGCQTEPQTFETPEAAVSALVSAMRAEDAARVRTIVGSEGQELMRSGDKVADDNDRAAFVRLYDEKATLNREENMVTLEIGNGLWPLPIPVVKGDKGWYFDVEAGADEMLSRRIGRNELDAIQVCLAIVDAQREYAATDRDGDGLLEYATKFASAPGKKDGLYWPAAAGEPQSPLGEIAAEAAAEGYAANKGENNPRPYHGYYYRILTVQGSHAPGGALDYTAKGGMIGGFGVIAWPAEYAGSGLKSFQVSHHGVLYEKDLGDDTDRLARGMKAFDPGEGWIKGATADGP